MGEKKREVKQMAVKKYKLGHEALGEIKGR